MKKIYRGNLFFFIILVWGIFSSFLLYDIFKELQIFDPRIRLVMSHFISFFIPSILYVIITKQKFREVFKFRKLKVGELILIIVLGIVCVPFTGAFGSISSIFFKNTISDFMGSIGGTPYLILLLLIAVMPAITEEISLRGVVLSNYDEKSNFKAALVGGFLFGVFHLNAHQFIYTAALGFVLVYAVRVTGCIFSSMIIHFIINGTSVTLQKIQHNAMKAIGESEKVVEVGSGINVGDIVGIIFTIVITGGIIYTILKKLERINIVRGNINKSYSNVIGEKIINLPLIMSVIVFIVFMTLFR
ncbi:MAG: lysostaphin resistance A-like protein [Clostridium sp.]|uniref:CPBP family intramembrane glutamic endopeptidase n=1 Tax=Clostridium sp. TaxID=1506 RepID=UPI003F39D2B4